MLASLHHINKNPWNTSFTQQDVLRVFDMYNPSHALYHMANFNLAWFVSKVFCNQQGKPLELEAFQQVMLQMLWSKKFPMIIATRGGGKSFMLALYAFLKAILVPGSKIVICGAGFRQAKLVFKFIENLYEASPIIKEAVSQWGGPKYGSDMATLRVGLSTIQAIPIGDGEKIRGIRATCLIADEFASIPEEIFDIVISPFTAVHVNPAERAAHKRFVKRLVKLNAPQELITAIDETQGFGNQIVLSGTPSYKHNHFYKRYCVYRMFIQSRGDAKQLKKALEEKHLAATGRVQDIAEDDLKNAERTWKQYAIFQLPYTAIPEGFLDEDNIRSDKASFPKHRFEMEYLAKFPDDTDGFIRRSWIDRATPRDPEQLPVTVELYGDPKYTYVMGLDPARWNDNFGCVVFKLTPRGKEFVYCNAWDKTEFGVSAQKIREIVKRFNISYITMDTGGGGEQVREWLCKKVDNVLPEDFIWVVPDQMEKFTGDKRAMAAPGKKILEMVDFTPHWISQAAHGVAADIEQCNILFPYRGNDTAVYDQYIRHFGLNTVSEKEKERLQQSLWGLDEWDAERMTRQYGERFVPSLGTMQHIDECLNETCAITRNVTAKGVESFDLPKLSEQPEGLDMRRRDRWSALMLANYAAKVFSGSGHTPNINPGGIIRKGRGYTRKPSRRGFVSY
jgi:Terminase RNaseH-like domain